MLLLLTCSSISHAQFIGHGLRYADWGVAKVILIFLIPGVIGGVWVFRELSSAWLTLVLGVVISIIVAISFTDIMNKVSAQHRHPLALDRRGTGDLFGMYSGRRWRPAPTT